MRPLALIVGGFAALLLALVLVSTVVSTLDRVREPNATELARRDAEIARLDRAQQLAEDLYWLDRLVAACWRVVPLVAVVGGLAFVAARAAAYARFRRTYADPSPAGLLPVELADQATARAALAAYHGARLEDARRAVVPVVPATLTYSPHYSHRQDAAALLPGDVAPALAAAVPSFAQLLDSRRVGQGNPMLLGYDAATGAPVEGSWLDLYSCGLGGLSGSGKSWTACYLSAQAALFDTRIVLLDPHAAHAESLAARLSPLAGRFVCATAESPREMLAAVELVAEELRRRKAGARGAPMLFIADEYSALQRGELADPLGQLVEALGQEGRKLGLYALVAGQIWTGSRAGGTEVRDSLASAFVHRCRPAQARYLTGMTAADLPGDLLELPAGTCYLLNTAGEFRKVTIPQMGAADMGRVALLLDGNAAAAPASTAGPGPRPLGLYGPAGNEHAARPWPGPGLDSGPAQAGAAPRIPMPIDAEATRILARFAAGASIHEIACELASTPNPGDRKYKAARTQVEQLLRAIAQGRGAAYA